MKSHLFYITAVYNIVIGLYDFFLNVILLWLLK